MNDSNEKDMQINDTVRKIAFGLSAVVLVAAVTVLSLRSGNDAGKKEEFTTAPVTENMEVENKISNEPDTRVSETIIVPATEVTTQRIADDTQATTAEKTTASAPASYVLPFGTDVGLDYSNGMPVYNDIMNDWRSHDGVDFNGECGDGVKAIADGIVREVATDALYASVIKVDHGGGVVASYCGVVPEEDIMPGVIVSRSQKIGEICEIPCESNAVFDHLHLEIRVDGELADPLEVMGYYE